MVLRPRPRPRFPSAPPRAGRAVTILSGLILLVAFPASAGTCPSAGEQPAGIASVLPRLELKLADGRLVRLAGLDPASATPDDPDLGETVRVRLAAKLAGRPVALTILTPAPDRWGRLVALVFVEGGDETAGGLGAAAIAGGLGRYLAEPAARDCREAMLRAEAAARQAKLGLWADPYYAVLAVDDHAGFRERTGTNVVAEGLLTEIQTGPFRTTLRFAVPASGSHGGHMLVATILPRVMKTFQARHLDLSTLVGRQLRLRGLLDMRFGPQIELDGPDAVELVGQPPAGQPGGGAPSTKP